MTTVHDADKFLAEGEAFRLGDLPTESQHPKTLELSRLAREDVSAAVRLLTEVDGDALEQMLPAARRIEQMREAVADTLRAGGRIFLVGCGATGRLSIALEVLWRQTSRRADLQDAVVAFMAGGDLALVHSIENFEDHPEYGARQLRDLGFGGNDLLIASTEGGETPFVIGATRQAAQISRRAPWFLYCNPDESLVFLDRSRRVIENPNIEKICLFVGPMALSGSTRMQASTVLQLAVGLALLGWAENASVHDELQAFAHIVRGADLSFLTSFIEAESAIYASGGYVLYEADAHGITIVTDTTERAPTFSLLPFENTHDPGRAPSLCYVHLVNTPTSLHAWNRLLLREPRTLEWDDVRAVAGRDRLLGFDFSDVGESLRAARVAALEKKAGRDVPRGVFRVGKPGQTVELELDTAGEKLRGRLSHASLPLLFEHLLLKIALNIHSTLVMGRLGRYEHNLMTWVRPSNKKLIDRTIRYVRHLLRAAGQQAEYADVARAVFAELETSAADVPIVLRALERVRRA